MFNPQGFALEFPGTEHGQSTGAEWLKDEAYLVEGVERVLMHRQA